MSNVLLRKITRKSIIGFGQFKDWSVGQMIDMCKVKELLSMYYGLSKIDFCDELKRELCMTEEFQIPKPGRVGSYDWRIGKVIFYYINSLSEERLASNQSFLMKSHRAEKKRKKVVGAIKSKRQQSRMLNRERIQKH